MKIKLTHNGKKQSVCVWAEQLGMSVQTLYTRRNRGWSDSECLVGRPRKKLPPHAPRRNTPKFMVDGKELTIHEIAKITGIKANTLFARYYQGCRDVARLMRKVR